MIAHDASRRSLQRRRRVPRRHLARWPKRSIDEVNFTFDGHETPEARCSRPHHEELQAGDVSLAYSCCHRFTDSPMIRRSCRPSGS